MSLSWFKSYIHVCPVNSVLKNSLKTFPGVESTQVSARRIRFRTREPLKNKNQQTRRKRHAREAFCYLSAKPQNRNSTIHRSLSVVTFGA